MASFSGLHQALGITTIGCFFNPLAHWPLHTEKDNSKHAVTFTLGRLKPGKYPYSCAMGMVEGVLVVK